MLCCFGVLVFPAHAGMNLRLYRLREAEGVVTRVPRTRGDEPFLAKFGVKLPGRCLCVPRTRGDEPSLNRYVKGGRRGVVFPAHAGMNRPLVQKIDTQPRRAWCSPHTRG